MVPKHLTYVLFFFFFFFFFFDLFIVCLFLFVIFCECLQVILRITERFCFSRVMCAYVSIDRVAFLVKKNQQTTL